MLSYMTTSFWEPRNSKVIVSYKVKLHEQAQHEDKEAALFPFPRAMTMYLLSTLHSYKSVCVCMYWIKEGQRKVVTSNHHPGLQNPIQNPD